MRALTYISPEIVSDNNGNKGCHSDFLSKVILTHSKFGECLVRTQASCYCLMMTSVHNMKE